MARGGGECSVPTRLQLLTSEWRTDAQDRARNFLSCLTKTSEQRALGIDVCVSVCVCMSPTSDHWDAFAGFSHYILYFECLFLGWVYSEKEWCYLPSLSTSPACEEKKGEEESVTHCASQEDQN